MRSVLFRAFRCGLGLLIEEQELFFKGGRELHSSTVTYRVDQCVLGNLFQYLSPLRPRLRPPLEPPFGDSLRRPCRVVSVQHVLGFGVEAEQVVGEIPDQRNAVDESWRTMI